MLSMSFELVDPSELPENTAIDIQEDRGRAHFLISSALGTDQVIQALNFGAEQVIRGGHWFQEWKGEIHAWSGTALCGPGKRTAAQDENGAT